MPFDAARTLAGCRKPDFGIVFRLPDEVVSGFCSTRTAPSSAPWSAALTANHPLPRENSRGTGMIRGFRAGILRGTGLWTRIARTGREDREQR